MLLREGGVINYTNKARLALHKAVAAAYLVEDVQTSLIHHPVGRVDGEIDVTETARATEAKVLKVE